MRQELNAMPSAFDSSFESETILRRYHSTAKAVAKMCRAHRRAGCVAGQPAQGAAQRIRTFLPSVRAMLLVRTFMDGIKQNDSSPQSAAREAEIMTWITTGAKQYAHEAWGWQQIPMDGSVQV